MIIPPFLKSGDLIGITAPAGAVDPGAQDAAVKYLEDRGYRTLVSPLVGENYLKFSAKDEIRKEDMQSMLDNPEVKAILCARGGYGSMRIIDDLDFSKFSSSPKWLIGFSDITTFHNHIHTNYNIATMHGQMLRAFWPEEIDDISTTHWIDSLEGNQNKYLWTDSHESDFEITAPIVGGNLAIISDLCGTNSDIDTTGKILVIEDVSEYLYNLDRMLIQLKKANKLSQLEALIIGAFTDIKDNEIPFGESLEQIVRRITADYDYEVVFNFPFGHQPQNWPILLGCDYRLSKQGFDVQLEGVRNRYNLDA